MLIYIAWKQYQKKKDETRENYISIEDIAKNKILDANPEESDENINELKKSFIVLIICIILHYFILVPIAAYSIFKLLPIMSKELAAFLLFLTILPIIGAPTAILLIIFSLYIKNNKDYNTIND